MGLAPLRASSCRFPAERLARSSLLDATSGAQVPGRMTLAPAPGQSLTARSRAALPMTLTDESAMAAAAIIGDSRMPRTG